MRTIRDIFRFVIVYAIQYLQLPFVVGAALLLYVKRSGIRKEHARVVFGGCGIINHRHWCAALRKHGYDATTAVWSTPSIYGQGTFDFDLNAKFGSFSGLVAPLAFVKYICKFNIVVTGFDGFFLGITSLKSYELALLRLARCKTIMIPYGGDAYVYSKVQSMSTQHALQISYPKAARRQREIAERVNHVTKKADFIITGTMGFDGIGRWDLLTPNPIVIDTELWTTRSRKHSSSEMVVVHTPNHRGFKGTEYLVQAVKELNATGLNIVLKLLEGKSNAEVREVFSNEADVLVEQLVAPGYAMSAIEGMSCGLVVLSNIDEAGVSTPFRRWSFLNQCPIVSTSPESIKQALYDLYFDVVRRQKISAESREYVLNFHSYDSFAQLFTQVESYLQGGRESLINYYHPLLGESLVREKGQTSSEREHE